MRTIILSIFLLTVLSVSVQAVHAATIGPNVDVAGEAFPDRQRVEPTIAVDPHNPSIIVAGAQDLRLVQFGFHRWHGYYRSIDGGATWSSSLVPGFPGDTSSAGLSSALHGFRFTTDPVLAFDRTGNVYYAGIIFGSRSQAFSLFVAKYVNDGADFAGATIICFRCADKPWIAVDTSGGAGDGTVYVSFDSFITGLVGVAVVHSNDGGATYSSPQLAIRNGFLSGITGAPNGRVFVAGRCCFAGKANGTSLQVSVSADGGLSFPGRENVATITPPPSPLPGNGFRVDTIPQIASDSVGVYVVWDDFGTGTGNIMFSRSQDNAVTWTAPLTLNDVTTGQHFFPTVAASAGIISVAWYDSRLGQTPSGTITSLDVFYAKSTDAGASFSPNLRISTASFDPNLVVRSDFGNMQPFIGDYIETATTTTTAYVIWTDNRNACDVTDHTFGCIDQDAMTAAITF